MQSLLVATSVVRFAVLIVCLSPSICLFRLATIAPQNICRVAVTRKERCKQSLDPWQPLHEHIAPSSRLKSRKSFIKISTSKNSKTATEPLKQSDKTDLFQFPAISGSSEFLQTNLNLRRKNSGLP